jgi:sirohydrochlorin ferrochelatase
MRTLLLVAHGSRREESNEEVRGLAAVLAEQAGERFGHVDCAFLEIADPSIPDAIEAAVQAGASEIVVLPYFLSAGRHVREDIPAEVERKRAEHPEVRLRIAPYLGQAECLASIALSLCDIEYSDREVLRDSERRKGVGGEARDRRTGHSGHSSTPTQVKGAQQRG